MLLAALLDAGADGNAVNRALAACSVGAVVRTETVHRAGLRAAHLVIDVTEPAGRERTLADCLAAVEGAGLPAPDTARAVAVLAALGAAEAAVHGVEVNDVHLHELSAVDTLVDVVGVCTALGSLGVTRCTASPLPVAWGSVTTAHGVMPLPAPATLELLRAARASVLQGEPGVEQVTPTGAALVSVLATTAAPAMRIGRVGIGAGSRDDPRRPNVVRAWIGAPVGPRTSAATPSFDDAAVELRCNLDDVSPAAVAALAAGCLEAGALDAWVIPAVLKKGRPGHVLHVLAAPGQADALGALVLASGATLGVRATEVRLMVVDRVTVEIVIDRERIRVKRRLVAGVVVDARPELDDCVRVAAASGRPLHVVVDELTVAARRMTVPGS